MRLAADMVLSGVAEALRDRITPALSEDFAREAARMATGSRHDLREWRR